MLSTMNFFLGAFEVPITQFLTAVKVAFGIGFIIFIHELGHFLAAKKVGIRVETFSLGFGPRVIGFRRGETDYRLSVLPLGGYVKMAGETPGDVKTGSDDEYTSKTVGQRAFVLSAGVIMNLLSAFVMFPIAFRLGVPFTEPIVGEVEEGSPAWQMGLERGDRVVSINGEKVYKFEAIFPYVALSDPEEGLLVDLDRDGDRKSVRIYPRKDKQQGLYTIGIRPLLELQVDEGTPAYQAGLRTGDIPLSVDGQPFFDDQAQENLQQPDRTVKMTVLREDEPVEVEVTTKAKKTDSYRLGVAPLFNVVGGVKQGSLFARMGLKQGDEVVSAGGEDFLDPNDLLAAMEAAGPGSELALVVQRSGEETTLRTQVPAEPAPELLKDVAWQPSNSNRIRPVPGSPVAELGAPRGSAIVRLGGKAIATFDDIREAMADYEGGETLALSYQLPASATVEETRVEPVALLQSDLGIAFDFKKYIYQESNVLSACKAGFHNTWVELTRVVLVLHRMVTGSVSPKNLGGPVTIARATYAFAEGGFAKLLIILGILSVNLAVFNLLPIPVLDGGQLLFLAIEKIKGSPVSEGVLGMFQWAGLILILALLLFVTFQDIQRLF